MEGYSLKICRFARDFPSLTAIEYGIAPGVYDLSREQVKLGAEVHIITNKLAGVPDYEEREGVRVYRVKVPYNIEALRELRKLDKKIKVDVVHAHGTSPITFALVNSLVKMKPYVVHIHDTTAGIMRNCGYTPLGLAPVSALKERFWIAVTLARQRFMWKRADMLIAVSNGVAGELSELYGVPHEKIRVVHNGVDVNLLQPVTEETRSKLQRKLGIKGNPVILYVGHLSPRKGSHYLLKAVPQILKAFPKAVFVFVGGIPKFLKTSVYWSLWHDIVERLGIQEHVLFVGEVKHREALDFYAAADVFVLPTFYEGLPKATLEAMATGLPVVTTNIDGNSELVLHGKTGYLVEPGHVNELADMIIQVLLDPSKAKTIGLQGRKWVEAHFTWRQAAEKIIDIYEELRS